MNEWKKFILENSEGTEIEYGNEGFEKRFVDAFSQSTQDRAFLKKLETTQFDMTGMEDKTVGQLQAGMSHTWYMNYGLEGAEFIIEEKVSRYLEGISDFDRQYLEKFFGRIFGELNYYKMNRIEKKYKRRAAWLGRHQMGDWWIADDGIEMFYMILKEAVGI